MHVNLDTKFPEMFKVKTFLLILINLSIFLYSNKCDNDFVYFASVFAEN